MACVSWSMLSSLTHSFACESDLAQSRKEQEYPMMSINVHSPGP